MKIAFNPSTVAALTTPPNNKDITFDLRGRNIFARGVKFKGTDTNTWRDIKINNVSIGSNILDLRNGSNTTLTNTNGVVTINSTWRPVVDNLTSNSATSSLSANLGRVLAGLINGKSDSDHNHDDRYVKKTGDTMFGALNFANGTWNLVGDDSYMGDCNVSGHFGIKAANTTYPGISFFNNANDYLGSLTAYSGNIKYGAYSLQFLDNGNTSVSASTWTNPFSAYDSNAVADGQAICVWGLNSYLGSLANDTGDMSLWLKRVNANVATLNMVLDGEYYANGNLRLAHVSEIPNSLKNPHALTISLNGTSQGPYDGSAAKNINITPSSIGAATSDHNHINYLSANGLISGNIDNIWTHGTYGFGNRSSYTGTLPGNSSYGGFLVLNPKATTTGTYYTTQIALLPGYFGYRIYDDNIWYDWKEVSMVGHNHDGRYVRYYAVTTLDCNNLIPGLTAVENSATNSAVVNHSAFLYISDVGTPFQIQIPDSNTPYIFKRSYRSGKWGSWFKLNAGYADSAGSASNLIVHLYLSNTDTTWYPLIWGGGSHNNTSDSTGEVYKSHDVLSWLTSSLTLYAIHLQTTYIDLQNNRGISLVTSGGTSPYKGIKLPDLQSNGIGIFSRVGNGADEGGIIISEDTSVIYNSFNTGWGLSVRDKDLNQTDISGDNTIAFGIRQDYRAYSLGGFEKSGSDNSYVLLGGGGHKLESALNVNYASSAGNSDTVDGYHADNIQSAGWRNLYRTGGSSNVIKWTRIGRCITTANDNAQNDGMVEFHTNGDQNYKYFGYGRLQISQYGQSSRSLMLQSFTSEGIHFYATIDEDNYIWLGHNAWWSGNSAYRVIWSGSYIEWYSSGMSMQTSNPNSVYVTDNGTFKKPNETGFVCLNNVYVEASKLKTARKIWGQVFDGTADVNGTIYINNSNSSNGAIRLNNNINANARISAIDDKVIFNTGNAIRFGETAWDWNQWAGLKYTHSNKTIYLGIADGSVFNANSAQSNGTLKFPGITTITPDGGARIGGSSGDLYLGNANNSGWVKVQDMCSQQNTNNWRIYQSGAAVFNSLTINGGSTFNGSVKVNNMLTAKGIMFTTTDVNAYGTDLQNWDGSIAANVTNMFNGISYDNISIEYSRDNGASWTTYTSDPSYRFNLVNDNVNAYNFYLGKNTADTSSDANNLAQIKKNKLRVTVKVPNELYQELSWISVDVNNGVKIKCQVYFGNNSGTYTEYVSKVMTGWSHRCDICVGPLNVNVGNDTYRYVRLVFSHLDNHTDLRNGIIAKIRALGLTKYSRNSHKYTLATTGHIYDYDYNMAVTFPNNITAHGLMRADGFHHRSVNSDNYMLLAGGGYKSFGGNYDNPIFLGYLNLGHGNDGTISSSFSCLGYSVPFTYTRGRNYCRISIPDTTHQVFYIKAAIASVNYSGGGMDTWVGEHKGDGAWWLHCYVYSSNEVRVKGFRNSSGDNDGWWGGNPLYSSSGSANVITVCLFGYVTFR